MTACARCLRTALPSQAEGPAVSQGAQPVPWFSCDCYCCFHRRSFTHLLHLHHHYCHTQCAEQKPGKPSDWVNPMYTSLKFLRGQYEASASREALAQFSECGSERPAQARAVLPCRPTSHSQREVCQEVV